MFDLEALQRDIERITTGATARGDAQWIDEPMPLDVWLRDPAIFGKLDLSDAQYDVLRHAERVLLPGTYEELGWPEVRQVHEFALAVGKGGGKGLVSRLIIARAIYQLEMMRDPLAYWGFPSTDTIHFMNLAVAAPQARHVIFTPMLEMFKASRFYRERMDARQTWIEFDKGLMAESGHSQQESQEGRSVLVGIIDEISGFKTAHELDRKLRTQGREPVESGEGIHRMLRTSIRSRFPTGKLIAISYPRFKGCMIDSLVRDSEIEFHEMGEASPRYSLRAATWEFNPLVPGKEAFADEYRRDPVMARTMYEAKPSASQHRYFYNMLNVRKAMGAVLTGEADRDPPVLRIGTEYFWGRDPMNHDESVDGWQVEFDLEPLPMHTDPMALHVDLALKHDTAGLAAAHVDGWITDVETITDEMGREIEHKVLKPRIVVDFVLGFDSIPPDPERGLPGSDIQMRWVRQLVRELLNRGWRVGTFTADGYQSADLLQTFQSWGIEASNFSLDRTTTGYDTLKSLIYEGAVTIPWHPILFGELEALTKLSNGRLDHPAGLSKDYSDSTAGAVYGAVQLAEANAPYDPDEDSWVGAPMSQPYTASQLLGSMMKPTSPTAEDEMWEVRREAEEAERSFWNGGGHAPVRSSDQPWDL